MNKNFAFFEFSDWQPESIQQSKVYFTILSVIHTIRTTKEINQTVFERFLLSPENYNRFNDGVIQAAILRGANENELNYQISPKSSQLMSSIICASIDESDNKDSAPYEFLMSLCIQKMSLCKSDIIDICTKYASHKDSIIQTLLKVIRHNVVPNKEIERVF